MAAIPKGTKVRQVVPAIEGVLLKTAFNEDTQQLQYLVGYVDSAGETAERWFDEDQIAAVKDEAPAADAAFATATDAAEVQQ